jgi:histidine ammonia-lyase
LIFGVPENGAGTGKIVTAFRKQVAFNEKDRVLHDDMINAIDFIGQDPAHYIDQIN